MRGGGRRGLQEVPKDFSRWQNLRRTMPHFWPSDDPSVKLRLVLALVLVAVQRVLDLAPPYLLSTAVEYLTPPNKMLPIIPIAFLAFSRMLASVLGSIRQVIFQGVSSSIERKIALDIFVHLQRLSLSFHLNRKTGTVLRSVSRGAASFASVMNVVVFNLAPVIVQLVAVSFYLFTNYNRSYSLITGICCVLYITYSYFTSGLRDKMKRARNEKDNEFNQKAVDALLNFETVKYFNAEDHEAKRYHKALLDYRAVSIESQRWMAVVNAGSAFIVGFGVFSVMLLCAYEVVNDTMQASDFVLIQGFILTLYRPLGSLAGYYRQITQNLIDVENMFDILNHPVDVKDRDDSKELVVSDAHIKFENVHFAYDSLSKRRFTKPQTVLRGISFEVKRGEQVAIVGPSGAGKSTIGRLLYRFYDVSSGSISIDGQDLRDVTQKSLRREIGIVPQECVLFNDTLGYNIGYGIYGSGAERDASKEEIAAAARAAQLDTFLEKNDEGFERTVGERGLRLSGGEKQRVAIARAILKAPKIMVFDEATSSLDSQTEQGILTQLDSLSRGRSSITIAHRLSTIVNSDRILVLKGGHIVEQGTHNELLLLDGEYKEMWDMQQESAKLQEEMRELKELERQKSEQSMPKSKGGLDPSPSPPSLSDVDAESASDLSDGEVLLIDTSSRLPLLRPKPNAHAKGLRNRRKRP